jgi:hypothetical protein
MNSYIGPDELIYNNDVNGNIYSGGFNVNSIMMKGGFSPIITLNESNAIQIGGAEKVSDLFNNLVIPNWGLSYNYKNIGGSKNMNNIPSDNNDNEGKNNNDHDDEVITEELHERLLNLVKASEDDIKQKQTKTFKNTKKNNKLVKINKKSTKKHKVK